MRSKRTYAAAALAALALALIAAAKFTDLAALTSLADGDVFAVVDVSDTSQAATGSTRKIAASDVANYIETEIDVSNVTTGTLPAARGGTGQTTYTDGQLLIGNSTGNTLAKGTLTGTANRVTVTNGGGSITLSAPQDLHTAATPTFSTLTSSVATGTAPLTVASTTKVANLNADALDDQTGSHYLDLANHTGTLPVANGGTAVTNLSNILGTANQVTVSGGTNRVIGGDVTLSLPQSIHTGASVQFGYLGVGTAPPATDTRGHFYSSGAGASTAVKIESDSPDASNAILQIDRGLNFRAAQIEFQTAGATDWYFGVLRDGGSAESGIALSTGSDINSTLPTFYVSSWGMSFGTKTPAGGTSNYVLHFGDNTGNPTPATNTACLFAKDVAGTVELFACDEAGNVTQLSEHASDGPAWLYDNDGMPDRVSRVENVFAGRIEWVNRTRMERLLELQLAGDPLPEGDVAKIRHSETYVEYARRMRFAADDPRRPQQLDWDDVEDWREAHRNQDRARWQTARNEARAAGREFPEPQPAAYVRRAKPAWLN